MPAKSFIWIITTLKQLGDECFCPVVLLKENLVKTKDSEQREEKLFVTRKMGLVTVIPNATIVSWLKETLTLANNGASTSSTRKTTTSYATLQSASIKMIMEVGDWLILPLCMVTSSAMFPERYWLRASSRQPEDECGYVTTVATGNPLWD